MSSRRCIDPSEFYIGLKAGGLPPIHARDIYRHFVRGLRNSAPKREQLIARHDQRRAAIARIYLGAMHPVFAQAELECLHRLHAGPRRIKNSTPAAADFNFDLSGFKQAFSAAMRQAGQSAVSISGQGMMSELGVAQKYITPAGLIHDFVITRENKLGGIPDEVYVAIKSELEEGSQAGETMDDLADRVRAKFAQIDAGRARVIAQTETACAYGTGRQSALKQAGLKTKSWLTAGDEKVRLSHNEAQAEGDIPVNQAFGNGLMYPGDPDGNADEVINCRCVLQAGADDDEESET